MTTGQHRISPWKAIAVCVGLAASGSHAQGPAGTAFTYQGQLRLSGVPTNGTVDVRFSVWNAQIAGAMQAGPVAVNGVIVTNGLFSVPVDLSNPFNIDEERWIEVAVASPAGSGNFVTLTPRQRVTSTPLALTAKALAGPSTCFGFSNSSPALAVTNFGSGGAGSFAIFAQSSGNDTAVRAENRVIHNYAELGTATRGVVGVSVVNSGLGVYGSATGVTAIGVYGDASALSGKAVQGYHSFSGNAGSLGANDTGVSGTAVNALATAVLGVHTSTGNSGRLGSNEAGVKGSGPVGVFGQSDVSGGIGLKGMTGINILTGLCRGVYGQTSSSGGYGVQGVCNNTAGGFGVFGQSSGSGMGVRGDAGVGGTGVYGLASNSGSGVMGIAGTNGVGVYASCDNGTALWAVNAVSGLAARIEGFAYFSNNVGLGVQTPAYPLHHSSGARLTTGGVWTNACDRNLKENISQVDATQVLARLESLPISVWNYKNEPGVMHIGPMAQDFRAAFGMSDGDTTIATVDADGVALASLQALARRLKDKDAELQALRAQNAHILERLDALEAARR